MLKLVQEKRLRLKKMKRILIVEDDKGLREGIELALKREAFSFEEMQVKKGEEEIILSKTELKLL